MVKFVGKGAAKEMQRAYMEDINFEGTMRQTVRYLGAWLNNDEKNGMEVRKRKEAAHTGWMAMGGLWSNNQIERPIKMVVEEGTSSERPSSTTLGQAVEGDGAVEGGG